MGNNESKLISAAKDGDLDTVRDLVYVKNVDPNCQDKEGNTPLHMASKNNNLNTVKYLLKNGANVNCQNNDGRTPLHLAAMYAELNVVKYLLKKGANVNCLDKYGKTPLFFPVLTRRILIVEYLVSHGTIFRSWDEFTEMACEDFADFLQKGVLELILSILNGEPWILLIIKYAIMGKLGEIANIIKNEFLRSHRYIQVAEIISNPPRDVVRMRSLIDEFTSLPLKRQTNGQFLVSSYIWEMNRDLAIVNLQEIIRLFNHYPKTIDWISEYYGTFIFGTPLQNNKPKNQNTIACTNGSYIRFGTKFYSMPLGDFRRNCQGWQMTQHHTTSNKPELQSIRHEFGHVLQMVFFSHMSHMNQRHINIDNFANEIKKFLINIAKLQGWDSTARRISQYGMESDQEWFAESFANAQNVLDEPESEQVDDLINEARVVGIFAENIATDIGFDTFRMTFHA